MNLSGQLGPRLIGIAEQIYWRPPRPANRADYRAELAFWAVNRRVSRTRARARVAVPKMGDGLPKSACRSGLQTAPVLLRSKGVVVNDWGKGVH